MPKCSRAQRARAMLKQPSNPNERAINTVAVLVDPVSGDETIIGLAGWVVVTNRGAQAQAEEKDESTKEQKVLSPEERKKLDESIWGVGANFKFCEDAFIVGDEIMYASCEGKDYCSTFFKHVHTQTLIAVANQFTELRNIAIHPKYQRRGIGCRLMEEGLAEADRLGLQSILAASPEGEGLYKRYGFVEFDVMNFKLWEYEGGEGMGLAKNVMMRRPTRSVTAV